MGICLMGPAINASGNTAMQQMICQSMIQLFFTGSLNGPIKDNAITK